MKFYKKHIKPILLWFLILVLFELLFNLVVIKDFNIKNFLVIINNTLLFSSFFSILSNMFKEKVNYIITSILLFILLFIYGLEIVFVNTFKSYFTFALFGLTDQVLSFKEQIVKAIISNIFYVLILLLPFILYLIFKKKLKIKRYLKSNYFICISVILLCTLINIIICNNNSFRKVYTNNNEIEYNFSKVGVLSTFNIDIYRTIKPAEIEISNNEKKEPEVVESTIKYNKLDLNMASTSNSDHNKINNYINSIDPTNQNEYTGMFKDYNLIYITAESFSNIAISKELTPTLYKLTNSGFMFDNYYTPNTLSTIGGEFASLTGLFPDNSILSKWRSGSNSFPYGIGNIFKKNGYNVYSYHNNLYNYQDRNKYLKSQGFSYYLGCYNGLEKRMNCKEWPESDKAMFDSTYTDWINSDKPFVAYYMTVSGHFEYAWNEDAQARKHKSAVSNLSGTEPARVYVASQIELDQALESLIYKLKDKGILDKTIIVLLADHYPYALSKKDINSISTYERDTTFEVNHNSLIIWNSAMENVEIRKYCMSEDVIPTVYNLMGIEYDSRLFAGKDILSDEPGFVMLSNGNWISDYGKYTSSGNKFSKFYDEELPNDYINKMKNMYNDRKSISTMIVRSNYYKYLFE